MTNPFARAGWAIPTPHQVLGAMMTVAIAAPILGLATGGWAKACELIALVLGGAGIQTAKNYLSPQVMMKLQAVDARAMTAGADTVVNVAPGAEINLTTESLEVK